MLLYQARPQFGAHTVEDVLEAQTDSRSPAQAEKGERCLLAPLLPVQESRNQNQHCAHNFWATEGVQEDAELCQPRSSMSMNPQKGRRLKGETLLLQHVFSNKAHYEKGEQDAEGDSQNDGGRKVSWGLERHAEQSAKGR